MLHRGLFIAQVGSCYCMMFEFYHLLDICFVEIGLQFIYIHSDRRICSFVYKAFYIVSSTEDPVLS